MRRKFKCRCCGNCCRNLADAYNGCVSDADLRRWRERGRSDLTSLVQTLDLGPGNRLHLAWIDPETGENVERCPWLLERPDGKGTLCAIEEVKPDHCRAYPEHRKHAAATGCAGYTRVEKEVKEHEG